MKTCQWTSKTQQLLSSIYKEWWLIIIWKLSFISLLATVHDNLACTLNKQLKLLSDTILLEMPASFFYYQTESMKYRKNNITISAVVHCNLTSSKTSTLISRKHLQGTLTIYGCPKKFLPILQDNMARQKWLWPVTSQIKCKQYCDCLNIVLHLYCDKSDPLLGVRIICRTDNRAAQSHSFQI